MMTATTETNPNIRVCARCQQTYDWRRSPSSSLKMTYCGSLCERGALGFTIEALLRYEREAPVVAAEAPEDASAEERELVSVS